MAYQKNWLSDISTLSEQETALREKQLEAVDTLSVILNMKPLKIAYKEFTL